MSMPAAMNRSCAVVSHVSALCCPKEAAGATVQRPWQQIQARTCGRPQALLYWDKLARSAGLVDKTTGPPRWTLSTTYSKQAYIPSNKDSDGTRLSTSLPAGLSASKWHPDPCFQKTHPRAMEMDWLANNSGCINSSTPSVWLLPVRKCKGRVVTYVHGIYKMGNPVTAYSCRSWTPCFESLLIFAILDQALTWSADVHKVLFHPRLEQV